MTMPDSNSIRYDQVKLSRKQQILAATAGVVVMGSIGMLFFTAPALQILIALTGLAAVRLYRSWRLHYIQRQIAMQFKQALYSITSSLAAGKSAENAFRAVPDDLRLLYPHANIILIVEFEQMRRRADHGEPIERAFMDFADRTGIEEIRTFASIFAVGKRSGVDLVDVVRMTARTIGDKLELEQEIQVMIAQKQLESKLIFAVPLVMLLFLRSSSPDYIAPLYTSAGAIVMLIAFVLLAAAYAAGTTITNIRL